MNILKQKTSLPTKFLVLFLVGIILLPLALFLYDVQISMSYEFIQLIWAEILANIPCCLLAAVLWQIMQKSDRVNGNRIGTIAFACVFATIITGLRSYATVNVINSYIETAIEIILCFWIEKFFISISRDTNLLHKLSAIFNNIIAVYIYGIVAMCFLSWLPGVNWEILPIKILTYIFWPYLDLFTIFLPPIVNIDFSPVLAIGLLIFVRKQLAVYFNDLIIESEREE